MHAADRELLRLLGKELGRWQDLYALRSSELSRNEEASSEHHDHIINVKTREVIEFTNEEIELIQRRIAKEHGLRLVDHRLELYGVPIETEDK